MQTISPDSWPEALKQMPDPPSKLFVKGEYGLGPPGQKYICIVGSRKYSPYGKAATEYIIEGLRGSGICIVSGLAMGIDSIVHKAALNNHISTIAFPGSGLDEDVLYPRQNLRLSQEIIESGGSLVSEFEPDFISTLWAFPKRNRLMAALSDIVLVIEGTKESGSLITARLALDYNKTVCALPGSIFSRNSEGTMYLLKQGAIPISSGDDLKSILGFAEEPRSQSLFSGLSPEETEIVENLSSPISKSDLINELNWPTYKVQVVLMELEIKGVIKEEYGLIRLIR